MSQAVVWSEDPFAIVENFGPRVWAVAVLGAVLLIAGYLVPGTFPPFLLFASGGAILALSGLIAAVNAIRRTFRDLEIRVLARFADHDITCVVVTDRSGRIVYCNPASVSRLKLRGNALLAPALEGLFAAPPVTLQRLMASAESSGAAFEDRVSRRGQIRLAATAAGSGLFHWRLEDVTPSDATIAGMDVGLPVVVVSECGRILSRNAPMAEMVDPKAEKLGQIMSTAPVQSGEIRSVTTQSGTRRFRVLEMSGDDGRLRELYFLPPDFGGADSTQMLFDTLPVPLLKIAANGAILVANQSACTLLGNQIPDGTFLSDLVSGLGRSVTDWLQDAAAGRGLNRSEFLQVRGGDSDLFVQVSLKRDLEQGQPCLVAVLTDATELKTLEAQFVQSQKMQAIGQLAGGVAHDFNNLLTAISGHCDLLLLSHDQTDPEYGDLVQIHQNANRAASLVGQLLAFSRKQTLQPETIDLREVLSDLTHLLSRLVGERVQLVLRHHAGLPTIRADKRQLEQVFMNLVVNARDAMPEGGDVVIETEIVQLDNELRRDRAVIPAGDYVVVRVSDQGTGIPAESLQKIFEPFFTTKKTGEGTGLGLSTAYGIVKQTGGFIFADSMGNNGSLFTLYFPAYVDAVPSAPVVEAPVLAATAVRSEGVVLLVEDEGPVRAFASRALRLRGYTVLEADNAETALEILSDPALEVGIFVTDVVMPGMDGPTWVREALKERPDAKVVFVSGYAEDALRDYKERIPNSVFLPKPFSLQDLTTTVQAQLR